MSPGGLLTATVLAVPLLLLLPHLMPTVARAVGSHIRQSGQQRKELLTARASIERKQYEEQDDPASLDDEWEKVDRSHAQAKNGAGRADGRQADQDWDGVVGFFHPFCNAGGGGERVLWAAVRTTQQTWPKAMCVVYTGDHSVDKKQMISLAKERFNIQIYPPTMMLLYLDTRKYVLASSWPHFTLLGQSVGSLIVAYDAFSLLVPDIFIDTMGYAFALALCKWFFPDVPTAAYVHYPTISTDMLGSLDASASEGKGIHAGAGKGWRGALKRSYWRLFARLYGWAGGHVDVVMTNSSWTQNHIRQLWGPSRAGHNRPFPVEALFPPCAVEELERQVEVSAASERARQPHLLYIAQFRPEKNHQLVLTAFAQFLSARRDAPSAGKQGRADGAAEPHLVLVGSVRDSADETFIYALRILARELHVDARVTFLLNAPWDTVLARLRTSSVGINAMWNEHFGIGVVEYQAAGLISVVNDSGGPRNDIAVDAGDGPTGYHASSAEGYADAFASALALRGDEALRMRLRARKSACRFGEAAFEQGWRINMGRLVGLRGRRV